MNNDLKRIIALSFGLLSATPSAGNASPESGRAINHLAEIRAAVRIVLKDEASPEEKRSCADHWSVRELLAQWGNWGNWGNWNNWHNWQNWDNWGNWGNWGNW